MGNTAFDDFIDQQTAKSDGPEIDWDKARREWVQHLDEFYETVEGFLHKYIEADKIRIQHGTKRLHEEYIGSYEVATLAVKIGANVIEFDPVGTNLISAKGRVDMKGARGSVKFVLVPQDVSEFGFKVRDFPNDGESQAETRKPVARWAWKIATHPPRVRCVELREESFQDAIMEVVNG